MAEKVGGSSDRLESEVRYYSRHIPPTFVTATMIAALQREQRPNLQKGRGILTPGLQLKIANIYLARDRMHKYEKDNYPSYLIESWK